MAILHIDAQGGSDLSLLKSEYYTNPGVLSPVLWSYSLGRSRFDDKFINENKNYYSNPIETTYEFGDILVYWHCYGDGQVSCNVKARGSSSNLISFTHDNSGSRPVIEYYLDFAIDTTLKKGYFVVISLQHIPYEGNNWQEFIGLTDGGETLYNLLVNTSESGGAGSGYISNSLVSNKKMVGYNVPTSSAESTKTESVNVASNIPTANVPKIGNGFARIKFLRDWEGDEEMNYSTSEHLVGTWIDGSNLYEKTYEFLNVANIQNGQTYDCDLTNIQCIYIHGVIYENENAYPVGWAGNSTLAAFYTSAGKFGIKAGDHFQNANMYLTIRYIKLQN